MQGLIACSIRALSLILQAIRSHTSVWVWLRKTTINMQGAISAIRSYKKLHVVSFLQVSLHFTVDSSCEGVQRVLVFELKIVNILVWF